MAVYPREDTLTAYGQDAPAAEEPEEPLAHFRRRHRDLIDQHKALTGQLIELLEKDCTHLERECRQMSDQIERVRASRGFAEKGGYR